MELPAADAGVEDRPGARHRQHGRPEARRDDPAVARCSSRTSAARRACPRASSTSSPGTATRAPPSSRTRTSTRSPSPARPPSARRSPATVAGTDKKVTLELGGKGANIVFDDAPIDQAVEGIVTGIFFNQGQVCCAGSRLLVQESIQDELLDSLKRRLSTLRLGDPLDKNTDIGAINSAEQLARITALVETGRGGGRRALVPGLRTARRPATGSPRRSSRTSPRRTPIARDEIFGPVLSVLTFRTPDEAVAKANNSQYGLSAGIWTEKGSRILAVANKLRAGVVWANTFNKFDPTSPFGGYKESGFGREGGRHGLEAYLDV